MASKWSEPPKSLINLQRFSIPHLLSPQSLRSKKLSKLASNFGKRPLIFLNGLWGPPNGPNFQFFLYSLSTFVIAHLLIPHTPWLNVFLKRPLVALKWTKPPKSFINLQTFLIPRLLTPQSIKSKKLSKLAFKFRNGL